LFYSLLFSLKDHINQSIINYDLALIIYQLIYKS